MKERVMNRKLLLCVMVSSLSAQESIQHLEFNDFPLRKIDYIYKENGLMVALLAFNVWKKLLEVADNYNNYSSSDGNDAQALTSLKESCLSNVKPLCGKLKTFKRFIIELIEEWVEKREKTVEQKMLMTEIFFCCRSKQRLENASEQEIKELLQNIQTFVQDVYNNGPCASAKCRAYLSQEDNDVFERGLTTVQLFNR